MTARATPEWVGKTPNTKIPTRVRARVFDQHGGICHISKRKIMPGEAWECDHIIALINGGENRESNLAPALSQPHKEKTKQDVREKSIIARKRAKDIGIIKPKGNIKSAGFAKFEKERKPAKASLPPRQIYRSV